ncbi:hypothetical protein [Vitiosangium sp. GDMCC 1.1324]|uniref:hypothetical protein n=1 Tax=Vitiosangium sp. (strain GDMCC 1.1324) TaxID=2138576 RepID=UPI000D368EEC|nr:hypothetical protein [Vitiosangium sp. GDMCC 1.1324]PTL80471.1 hypothetical protein DAT35_27940 [Vitiosangium sp. GDMCC 1.1324]
MRGKHGGGFRVARLFGLGLWGAGVLLGAGSARAQQTGGGDTGQEEAATGALACFKRAEREVSLSEEQALRLCQGAASVEPAECYIASQSPGVFLEPEQAIELCRCATSTEPAECFQRADHETTLDTPQILQLCSPSLNYGLLQDCQSSFLPTRPWLVPHMR